MYACPIRYIGRPCRTEGLASARIFQLMGHMWGQLSGGVRVNVIVNGLLDNVDALLAQNSGNLGWRPVLFDYHLIYTPPEFRRFAVVALQTMLACIRLCLGVTPHIPAVGVAVAMQLTAHC